jgi:arginyl-tRNA--protein-N-Asp/Glu arginylyltransferase
LIDNFLLTLERTTMHTFGHNQNCSALFAGRSKKKNVYNNKCTCGFRMRNKQIYRENCERSCLMASSERKERNLIFHSNTELLISPPRRLTASKWKCISSKIHSLCVRSYIYMKADCAGASVYITNKYGFFFKQVKKAKLSTVFVSYV